MSNSRLFIVPIVAHTLSALAVDSRYVDILDHCSRRVCEPRRDVLGNTDPPVDGDVLSSGGAGGAGGGGGAESGMEHSITTIDGLNNVSPPPDVAFVSSETASCRLTLFTPRPEVLSDDVIEGRSVSAPNIARS